MIEKLMTFLLCVFWTSYAVLRYVYQLIKFGSDTWKTKINRNTIPKTLTEGWNHDFVTANGIKFHYVHAGNRDRPLMLLLHGFPEFWYSWRHQIRHFQKEYFVVAVDLRGYGESDKPSGWQNYTIDILAEDVNQLVKALGYNSCVLVGHDWGGVVSWQVVIRFPEIVSKFIVCNCPHPKAFAHYFQKDWRQMLKSWYMFFFQSPYLPEIFLKARDYNFIQAILTDKNEGGVTNSEAFTNDDIEAWKYTFSRPGALTPPVDYYRAAFKRPKPQIPTNHRGEKSSRPLVATPTLILWGTADNFLSTGMAQLSAEQCSEARFHHLEGISHWVQQDAPEQVNQLMDGFLSSNQQQKST